MAISAGSSKSGKTDEKCLIRSPIWLLKYPFLGAIESRDMGEKKSAKDIFYLKIGQFEFLIFIKLHQIFRKQTYLIYDAFAVKI